MSTTTETDLFLVELKAENWKRFTCFLLRPDGKHAIIRGRNASGKTSAVQALETLLCGAASRAIPDPIRHGESKATLTADLGEVTIRRTVTDKVQQLDVRAADGSKIARPQQLLDALRGSTFDVVGFMGARPQDQVDSVLAVCNVLPPVEAVREATGEEFPAKADESADAYLGRLSADDVGLYFVRRRDAGRTADQKRKALTEQGEIVRQLGDGGGELPSASALLDRIQALQAEENARLAADREAAMARSEYQSKASVLHGVEMSWDAMTRRVADLEKQLAEARAEEQRLAGRVGQGREVVAELEEQAQTLAVAADKLPDRRAEIADLRAKVTQVEQAQGQIARRRAAVEQQERLGGELADAAAEHERLDKCLSRLRYLRAHLLDNLNLGIDGLAVGQGELRLNGLSIRSASTAELLTVAVAVATRQESRLKIIWVDQGERLDAEHRALLLRLAGDAGWQVILTCVSEDEEPKIEIVEGD